MNYRIAFYIILSVFWVNAIESQDFTSLIHKAWENDAQLKSIHFELSSAEYALKEAKAMYGPSVGFQAQYTRASGGRVIEFPIGDIINPVYNTLNALTQTNSFPRLQNEEIYFLPDNFYDARIRIQQPIYYPDLNVNRALKQEQVSMKALEIKAYKRLVSKEVMMAYFGYNNSLKALGIITFADSLLAEVKKVTESMIRNGIALPAALYRVNSEIATLQNKKAEAIANSENVLAYIRHLTGDPDLQSIDIVQDMELMPEVNQYAFQGNEESARLDQAIKMARLGVQKEDLYYHPRIGAVLDLGSQDFDFGWAPYVLLGLNLEVNIFDSKRNKHRKAQQMASIDAYTNKKNHVDRQYTLQTVMAYNNLRSAVDQAYNFNVRLEAAQKFYRDILAAYKAGSVGYLEIIDARNDLTSTQTELEILKNQAWSRWAEYIYITAAWPID